MIPDGSTSAAKTKLVQQHKVIKTQFDITKACDDSLKQQPLEAFHNDCMEGVSNANVGFAQTTTLELPNHLYDSYGTITPSEMEDSINTMITPYDPSKPITKLLA